MDAVVEHIAETIRADDRAGVDAHAVADLGGGIERDIGEDVNVLAEQTVSADVVETLQHRARRDPHLFAQDAIRPDVGGRIDVGAGRHNRRGMYAGGEDRLGEEKREGFGKRDAGGGHENDGLAARSAGTVNDDRRRGALLGPGKVILGLGKSELAWFGAIRGGKAVAHQRRVAENAAAANSIPTLTAGGDDLALNSARRLSNLRPGFGWQKQTLTTDNRLIINHYSPMTQT